MREREREREFELKEFNKKIEGKNVSSIENFNEKEKLKARKGKFSNENLRKEIINEKY